MKKQKISLFLPVVFSLIALVFAFLLYVFMNGEKTFMCTHDTAECLTQAAQLPFFQKIGKGFLCLFNNFICVLKEVF